MRLKLSLLLVFIITYSWSQSGSTKTFTGNGTFPVPAGVTSLQVQAWGGGGSGGGASGAPLLLGRGAAGGGGGAYASNTLLVTPGTTLNVVVASQTSGTTGAGTAGGNSTITGFESAILAAGGSGGDANNAGGSPLGGVGGTIAASSGSVRFAGANGGNGNSWNLLGLLLSSGSGGAGASSGGAGGTAVSGLILSNGPGNAGSPPGGAGSGAINSALGASQIGGAGAAGRVIISYSCANFSLTSTAATNVCASGGSTSTVTLTGSATSLPIGNYVVTYNRSSPSATALTANLTVTTAGTGTFTAVGLTTGGSSVITITKLTSETCSSTISSNNTATVLISPAAVGGAVSGGTTICSGTTSGLLTLSGNTGLVIKWQSSVSPFTTWTDIATTTATYTSGVLTETTQFRAVVQSGSCPAVNSTTATVTVNPLPTILLSSSETTFCSTDTQQDIRISYSVTGSPVTYSVVWNSSTPNNFVNITDAALPGDGFLPYFIPAGVAPGTYTGTITVKDATGCVSPGFVITIHIVAPATLATTGIVNSVCSATTAQNATLAYTASNITEYGIDWDDTANAASLQDQPYTFFTSLPGSGVINTIIVSANAQAGTYSGTMYIRTNSCFGSLPITITILPATVGGTVNGGTTICSGSTSGLLTLSGNTGTVVKWQSSISPFSIWTDIATTGTTYTSGVLTETTQFRAVVQSGNCDVVNALATTVDVSPVPGITIEPGFTFCPSTSVSYVDLPYSGATGSPTEYDLVWDAASASTFEGTSSQGLVSESVITIFYNDNPAPGTYTGTLVLRNDLGCTSPGIVFSINVAAPPSITTTGIVAPVFTSTNAQSTTLSYTASTGNATSYSIVWDEAANTALLTNQAVTPYTFSFGGGTINTIQIPANVTPGTYNGILYFTDGDCTGSSPISIQVNDSSPTITLAPSAENRCFNGYSSQDTTLSYSATTGLPTTYSIIWNPSPANSFVAVTDAALPAGSIGIDIPLGAVPGTYTGTLTVKNANGTSSLGATFTVVVDAPASITTTGVINPVCASTNLQYASLPYTNPSGNPVSYLIDWDVTGDDDLLSFQGTTAFTFETSPGVINTIEIPANTLPGTYTGRLIFYDRKCDGYQPISITISPATVGGSVTGGTTIASGNTSGLLTLSGHTGDVVKWQSSVSPFSTWIDIANAIVTYTSGQLTETTQFRAVVQSGTCNTEYSELTTVLVEDLPTIALSEFADGLCEDDYVEQNEVHQTALAYAGTTGNPTTYSIVWNASPTNSFPAVTDAALPSSPITITVPAAAIAGTYTGTLTVKDGNGVSSSGSVFSVNIAEIPTITLTESSYTICQNYDNDYNLELPYSGTTGDPVTYSIVWPLLSGTFVPFTDAALDSGSVKIKIISTAPSGTFEGILTVKNANGCVSQNYNFNVTIEESPSAPVITQVKQPTNEYPTGDVILGGLPSTGNWSITTDPVTVSITGSGQSKAISGLAPGTYTFTVTNSAGCSSPVSDSVVINYPLIERGVSSKSITATEDLESIGNTISIFSTNKVINVETPNQIINQIFIYDVSGTLLYKKDTVSDSKLSIDNLRSANQVLVVKVVLNNNESATRKIIF